MTLTSLTFFAFVLACIIVYYIVPAKFRWLVLLAASLAFYGMICLRYCPFILFTAFSTWAGALWMGREIEKRGLEFRSHKAEWDVTQKKEHKHGTMIRKRLILLLVLVLNFGILAVLKYYDVAAGLLGSWFHTEVQSLGILLPLGISFYTFQAMGYMIDVYWEKTVPEKNPAKFLLFVTFFPQIVQGPIGVYNDLAHQLYQGHKLDYENIKHGFQLILWGLFKKLVIADRLVIALDHLLPLKHDLSNASNLLLLVIYCIQLYMDFSGGIDIVRGVAQMMGVEMALNFKRPFFSRSLAGFWQRWHISLCSWLKNYLFYPMAVSRAFLRFGNRICSLERSERELPEDSLWGGYTFLQHLGRVLPGCLATLITFFIIGIWHGASWKDAGYGIWNGVLIALAGFLDPLFQWLLRKLNIRTEAVSWKIWQILRTSALIGMSFAFDIADGFRDSLSLIWKCLTPAGGPVSHLGTEIDSGLTIQNWILAGICLLIVFAVSLYQEITGKSVRSGLEKQNLWLQWVLMLGCFAAIIVFGMYGPGVASGEFVYMQF